MKIKLFAIINPMKCKCPTVAFRKEIHIRKEMNHKFECLWRYYISLKKNCFITNNNNDDGVDKIWLLNEMKTTAANRKQMVLIQVLQDLVVRGKKFCENNSFHKFTPFVNLLSKIVLNIHGSSKRERKKKSSIFFFVWYEFQLDW